MTAPRRPKGATLLPRLASLNPVVAALAVIALSLVSPAGAQTTRDRNDDRDRAPPPIYGPGVDQPPTTADDDNQTRARAADDQSGLQTQIEQLGVTQEKPTPAHTPPDKPPDLNTPDDPPPPPNYPPPPPTIYGHDPEYCCALEGRVITYPIVSDPLKPADEYEAPHDAAVGAIGVFLHDGAFFTDTADLAVKALFYDIDWTRHWRSDVRSDRGGLMGYGWDFAFNKRIVPISSHAMANGLYVEEIGVDVPSLWFYDGSGHAEKYVESHSEQRKVLNFDSNFTAWVTTYKSPPGEFQEIERYVVLSPPSTHPFRSHPNVEGSEEIFYVVREKDGVRFVFDCRGQLIYILSRNDSTAHKVRVELDYAGPLNPLTQNQMLSKIIDANQRSYAVTTTKMDMGVVFTFFGGQLVTGRFPILHVKAIQGAGVSITYHYKDGDQTPILESVDTQAGDKRRTWSYVYDNSMHITDVRDPNMVGGASGQAGAKPLHIGYSGGKVDSEALGDQFYSLTYGDKVTVSDTVGNRSEYTLEESGGHHVVQSFKITDANGANGGPWTTTYQHNGDTQVTEVTNPLGDGVTYKYDTANSSVTLGPILDWYDHGLTYENNLAKGNLLGTVVHGPGAPSITTARKYDRLYNQPIEETDGLGAVTRWAVTDYDQPKNRGNPLKIDRPPVKQPSGGPLQRPTVTIAYDPDGQAKTLSDGALVTSYAYDASNGQVKETILPGGGFERFEYDALGDIVSRSTPDGTVTTERNGFGQIVRRSVDSGGLALGETYEYDNDGNLTSTSTEVRDTFGPEAPAGLKATPLSFRETKAEYDVGGHITTQTVKAGGLSSITELRYSPAGDLIRTSAPALDGGAPLVTTYRYDARHRLRERMEAQGSSAARTTTFDYDADGAQILQTTGSISVSTHRDGLGRIDTVTDPLGGQHTFVYDAAGEVTEHTVKGAAGVLHHSVIDYDGYGHPMRQTNDSLSGAPQVITTAFSARLLPASSTQADGGETQFTYDDQGRLTDAVDADGDRTHNTYDAAGHLTLTDVTTTERSVDRATGGLTPAPKTTTVGMTYDSAGRLTGVKTAQGEERRYLNSLGQVRGAVSTSGQLTSFSYDGLGRQTDVVAPLNTQHLDYTEGGLVRRLIANGQTTEYEYDALGRTTLRRDRGTGASARIRYDGDQTTVTDPNGSIITTTFNAAGQPLTEQASPIQTTASVPDFRGFRIVGGAVNTTFTYDEVGRVTKATSGNSRVTRSYDGLDRVTDEVQSWNGGGQTIKHAYADDFRSETITYPELAFSQEVTRRADVLGRVVGIEVGGRDVATYDYSGLDRLAVRTLANGVETRFSYDDQQRLAGIEIVSDQAHGAGATEWSATAGYDAIGLNLVTEFHPARPAEGSTPARDDEVLQSHIDRDPQGRTVGSTTTLASLVRKAGSQHLFTLGLFASVVPGGSTAVTAMQMLPAFNQPQVEVRGVVQEMSGAFNTYNASGLSSVAEFNGLIVPPPPGQLGALASSAAHALGLGGDPVRSLRIDNFTYDNAGRVSQVSTRGGYLSKVIGGLGGAADVSAAAAAAARTASGQQTFVYDANGNVISDGRYLYAYDVHNRLTRVQDRWTPFKYRESITFSYDAFGRRVLVAPDRDAEPAGGMMAFGARQYDPVKTWMLYDGDRVIAEVLLDQAGAARGPTLMARYLYGARPGEIVEMDRRPEHSSSSALVPLYLHEDFNGVVRYASTSAGAFLPIANDALLGTGANTAEAPAGDANMAGKTGVRVPYLGSSLRVDGFSGVRARDDGGRQGFDYRVAHSYLRDTADNIISETRTTDQNRLQVVVGAAVALPISIAVAGPTGAGIAALKGAGFNVGFGMLKSEWNDEYYSPTDMGGDAVQGAVFGLATGGIGQLGLAGASASAADILTVAGVGTAWDVGVHGARMEDAFMPNLAMSVAMHVAGSAISQASGMARASLLDASLDAVEAMPPEASAVAEATQGGGESEAATPQILNAEAASPVDPMGQAAATAAAAPLQPANSVITANTPSCACERGGLMRLYARLVRNAGDPAFWTNGLPARPRSLINAKGELTLPKINGVGGEFNCAACAMALDLYLRKGAVFIAEYAPPRIRKGQIQSDMEAIMGSPFVDMKNLAQVEAAIAGAAPGRGGILFMKGATGGGHVFNVINVGGRALAIDMQAQGLGEVWRGTVGDMLRNNGFTGGIYVKLMLTN